MEVTHLRSELEQEKLRSMLAAYDAQSLHQRMATLLPDKIKDKASFPSRYLASQLQEQEPIQWVKPDRYLEKAKANYRENRYLETIQLIRDFLDKFPDSLEQIEARFLLVESYYRAGEIEACTEAIEELLDLYPESEYTGFALLRLGMIFLEREKSEDAIDIFELVSHNFSYHYELKTQAQAMVKKAMP